MEWASNLGTSNDMTKQTKATNYALVKVNRHLL